MTKLPKNQHYVPQFLLRGFASDRGKVHVFDKREVRQFCAATRNIAAEAGFYNYATESGTESAEPSLARMEADCAKVVGRIREAESLDWMTDEERVRLGLFTAIQVVRVKKLREMLDEMNRHLRDKVVALGADPAEYVIPDSDSVKAMSIEMMPRLAMELEPHITKKAWLLLRAPESQPFFVSDNPVALQSTVGQPAHQGLGIGVEGVEIYLPLSSRLVLMFLCEALAEQFLKGAENALLLKWITGIPIPAEHLASIADAIKSGVAKEMTKENVDNLNSLQVIGATRFICGPTSNFSVIREMLKRDPGLKDRNTFRVS